MTRKTKEQKKIAEYRRRLKLLEQNTKPENREETKKPKTDESIKTGESVDHSGKDNRQQIYFAKDLKKSLIFIFLIITLEIVIYFVKLKIY